MKRKLINRMFIAPLAAMLCVALTTQAANAVPEADAVVIECSMKRMVINNEVERRQINLTVKVSSSTDERMPGLEDALLEVQAPNGEVLKLNPRKVERKPKRFKAAHASVYFRVIDDPDSPGLQNCPQGFLNQPGEFELRLNMRGEDYSGWLDFGPEVGMSVTQDGREVGPHSAATEQPLTIATDPAQFGPVYFKEADPLNFFYQMANMDNSLMGADFYGQVESPQYFFQIRIGDGDGGPTELVDPARYIDGHEPYLIRSDMTSTPLTFTPDELETGKVMLVQFSRLDTYKPDTVFTGGGENLSSRVTQSNKVLYVLNIEEPPIEALAKERATE